MNTQLATELIRPSQSRAHILETTQTFASDVIEKTKAGAATLTNGLNWIVRTSIVRQVAPGKRPLERHEYESVEIRRGGFGNVF